MKKILNKSLEHIKRLWGPYVHRESCRLLRKTIDTIARQTRIHAEELDRNNKRVEEALRRISLIQYDRVGSGGDLAIRVVVPAIELAALCPSDAEFFRYTAARLGGMIEREFAGLNASTLAQHIRAAEDRQRRIESNQRQRTGVFS